MELGNNTIVDMLPKSPPDQEPESIKLFRTLREALSLSALTQEEKSALERMMNNNDPALIDAIRKNSDADAVKNAVLSLIRSKSSPMDKSPTTPTDSPILVDSPPASPSKMDTSPDDEPLRTELEAAFKKISFQKPPTIKTSLSFVQKALQALEKHPEESKNRKYRMDNLAFKKHVVDIVGAQQIMEAVGFKVVVEKDKSGKELRYLEIDKSSVQVKNLKLVEDLIQKKLDGSLGDKQEIKAVPGKKVVCAGGCGYWGDENTENLCSLCHKKKIFWRQSGTTCQENWRFMHQRMWVLRTGSVQRHVQCMFEEEW